MTASAPRPPQHAPQEPSRPPEAAAQDQQQTGSAEAYAEDICQAFRQRLPAWMAAQGLTAFELGRRAGLSGQIVENLQAGHTQVTLRNLVRLAWALNKDVSELVAEMEQDAHA